MDDLAQPQLAGGPPEQAGQLGGVVRHEAAGDGHAARGDQLDRIPGDELALDRGDAGGQQGEPAFDDSPDGAVVEDQPASGGRGVGEPEQPGAGPAPGRPEQRAARAAEQRRDRGR